VRHQTIYTCSFDFCPHWAKRFCAIIHPQANHPVCRAVLKPHSLPDVAHGPFRWQSYEGLLMPVKNYLCVAVFLCTFLFCNHCVCVYGGLWVEGWLTVRDPCSSCSSDRCIWHKESLKWKLIHTRLWNHNHEYIRRAPRRMKREVSCIIHYCFVLQEPQRECLNRD
jgi:hypothetical protein